MVGQAPQMGRWLWWEKCRGRGEGAGAEDGDVSLEQVRIHAENRAEVGQQKAVRGCTAWHGR
jgi:hypothetical protein